jgi:fatty acid desaturase
MSAVIAESAARSINDPEIIRQVNALRRIDNVTNWYYLAREYLFVGCVIGGTIALYETCFTSAWSLLWAIPVTLLANLCVGATQHRLATFTHEAAHYMLFRNRLLNEFVSEWFCMLPLLGGTHSYRVQHIGHHQYPNDPDLDPDWAQLRLSGHRFKFPMTTGQFLWHCFFKQFLWWPNLLRYVLVRASFQVDMGNGPYRMKRKTALPIRLLGLGYHLAMVGVLFTCVWTEDAMLMSWLPWTLFGAALAAVVVAPERWYAEYSVRCDISTRCQTALRFTFNTLVLNGIAWLTLTIGSPWWLYYFLLWLSPLGTSFAFYMILRQIVQHGNADRERFTNTRIFLVHPLIRLAVFPIGNDFHLPHHLFTMVPHYNLQKLHELLMQTQPYHDECTIVPGYFLHDNQPQQHPTVLDLMTHEMKAHT